MLKLYVENLKTLDGGWMDGRMDGWMDGWMGGWVDGSKSRVKDCLQQSIKCQINKTKMV